MRANPSTEPGPLPRNRRRGGRITAPLGEGGPPGPAPIIGAFRPTSRLGSIEAQEGEGNGHGEWQERRCRAEECPPPPRPVRRQERGSHPERQGGDKDEQEAS